VGNQANKYPAQLSGGQQQRVAIARALAMDPKVMLFDEPTSALDPEMINEVLDVMITLAKDGMTMVVVTHEMGFARRAADRVVVMADGEIVEENVPTEFFHNARSARAKDFLSKILDQLTAVQPHDTAARRTAAGGTQPQTGGRNDEVPPHYLRRRPGRRGARPGRLWRR
jgi:ABC-type methionine transport system ATPase subunit